jgi:glycosyltransferase involved in cell wall biosynthesis
MVKKNKLIASIIIRGKNEARWLKILLPTLYNQTFKKFEIIFCDNDSSDNTLQILKKFKIKKILTFKKYLPGKILNSAIKICNGKFICILSSHCIPASNTWLEEHINYIKKNSNYAAVFGKQIPLPGSSAQNLIDLDIIFKDQEIIYSKDPYLNNANSIYNADILKKNLFNSKITNIEDREWANRIVKKGYKICYSAVSEVFHLHGIHQHDFQSNRSITTHNILKDKYLSKWKTCNFIKKENLNFGLIINARREHNIQNLKNKLKIILSKIDKNFKYISKIILISNFKNFKFDKVSNITSKHTLSADLKFIYNKFNNYCIIWNYLIYLNIEKQFDENSLKKLIDKTVYNCYISSTFGKILKENFIIKLNGKETYTSTSLINVNEKPLITVIKLSKGAIIDVDYIRKGILTTSTTHIEC